MSYVDARLTSPVGVLRRARVRRKVSQLPGVAVDLADFADRRGAEDLQV